MTVSDYISIGSAAVSVLTCVGVLLRVSFRMGGLKSRIEALLESQLSVARSNGMVIGFLAKKGSLKGGDLVDVMKPFMDRPVNDLQEFLNRLKPTKNPISQEDLDKTRAVVERVAAGEREFGVEEAEEFNEIVERIKGEVAGSTAGPYVSTGLPTIGRTGRDPDRKKVQEMVKDALAEMGRKPDDGAVLLGMLLVVAAFVLGLALGSANAD